MCRRTQPGHALDLPDAREPQRRKCLALLECGARTRRGERLAPKTIAAKIYRVCAMYAWFAEKGWFRGDLGPSALRKRGYRRGRASGGAHSRTGGNEGTLLGPTGSALAVVRGRSSAGLPRTLTASDLRKLEDTLARSIAAADEGSARRDQHMRDQRVFSAGRIAGLRVLEIPRLRLERTGQDSSPRSSPPSHDPWRG